MKKEEIAQYDELRSDVKAKTLILTQEKQKTEASVAKVMTFKWDTEAKNEWRNSRVFLTRKFKENNKDLLSRYEALVQKYKDSKELFNRLYDLAWEINPDISENEWRIFLDKNRDVGLSKEKLWKMPELEDSMFKMDSSWWERKKNRHSSSVKT